ncbi:cell division ATP-binding protein FtsE [Candidatus Berkelbacteria bacterium]|nr:cell division ATP-binding protein FtsE [Candidatus Berkelbacteria bacterium]
MSSSDSFIAIEHVSKLYGSVRALHEVNMDIKEGEFISLVGPSGAGKSTLMRMLIREELPTSGTIYVANRDITKLKSAELPYYRRRIGMVFQDYKLLPHKTVSENVAFALEVLGAKDEFIESKVTKILSLVGIDHRAGAFPSELSGGEAQRTSIARALIHSPKILLADEPTGNLDPDNAKEIIDLLEKIHQAGTIVILATHNKLTVDRLRRRVITLRSGEVVSDQPATKHAS